MLGCAAPAISLPRFLSIAFAPNACTSMVPIAPNGTQRSRLNGSIADVTLGKIKFHFEDHSMLDPELMNDYEPASLTETAIILGCCIVILLIVFGIGAWFGGR